MRDSWRLALGTLTAIPTRPPGRVDARVARGSALLAPVAALPLGLLVALVLWLGRELQLPFLAVGFLAVGALAAGSRALHLDGLSDTVDGLTSSYDRERSQEVMRSGSAGPAGVVALVVVLGAQASGFSALMFRENGPVLAGLLVCLSRAALAIACVRGIPAARTSGLGAVYAGTVPRSAAVLVWLVGAVLLAALYGAAEVDWTHALVSVVVAVGAVALLVHRAVRRFGGVNGDVFGACIEVALLVLVVGVV